MKTLIRRMYASGAVVAEWSVEGGRHSVEVRRVVGGVDVEFASGSEQRARAVYEAMVDMVEGKQGNQDGQCTTDGAGDARDGVGVVGDRTGQSVSGESPDQ